LAEAYQSLLEFPQEQGLTEERIRTTYVESAGDNAANTATLS
jgi:hypothetical protein